MKFLENPKILTRFIRLKVKVLDIELFFFESIIRLVVDLLLRRFDRSKCRYYFSIWQENAFQVFVDHNFITNIERKRFLIQLDESKSRLEETRRNVHPVRFNIWPQERICWVKKCSTTTTAPTTTTGTWHSPLWTKLKRFILLEMVRSWDSNLWWKKRTHSGVLYGSENKQEKNVEEAKQFKYLIKFGTTMLWSYCQYGRGRRFFWQTLFYKRAYCIIPCQVLTTIEQGAVVARHDIFLPTFLSFLSFKFWPF